jgi:phage protein D
MTAFLTPTARRPRGAVKINGEIIPGWVELEVENVGYYSVDTFRVTFAIKGLPPDRNLAWFSEQEDMFVELFIGFPDNPSFYTPAELQSWIYGQVDDIEDVDLANKTFSVTGRDLTRVFVDTKTTQKWPNQTASQIATALAKKHGLTPSVTKTTAKVGKCYQIDHVQMAKSQSEWDILTYLADSEGFNVWVRGQTLYFQPAPDPGKIAPYDLIYQQSPVGGVPSANFERMKFKRALTVSRGIQVQIRSWNKRQGKGFTVTYPSNVKTIKVGQSSVGAGAQIYSKRIPNLTQDQALQHAQNWYRQLIAHELIMDGTMPGDNSLDTTSIIRVSGTGTAFDQLYYPDSISRTLSVEDGYDMTISAKSHAPDSEIML